jgi:hypothetical protein
MARNSVSSLLLATALAVVGSPSLGVSQSLTWGMTLGLATGSYSMSERTNTIVVETSAALSTGRWRLQLWLPVIAQNSPYVTYSGRMALPTGHHYGEGHGDHGGGMGGNHHTHHVPDPDTIAFDEAGIGDPVLRGDLMLAHSIGLGMELDGFAAIKASVASEASGFGTGAWDYGAGLTLSRAGRQSAVALELGYVRLGDPETIELLDPVTARLTYSHRIGGGENAIGGYLRGSTATVADTEAPVEAAVFVTHRLGGGAQVDLTLSAGLTATAPDAALRLGWWSAP